MFSHFPITRSRGFLEDGTFWLAEKFRKFSLETYPGVPVVTNPPCNARDTGSIPGPGTKIPHAKGQLSLLTATRESPGITMKRQHFVAKTQCSQINKWAGGEGERMATCMDVHSNYL